MNSAQTGREVVINSLVLHVIQIKRCANYQQGLDLIKDRRKDQQAPAAQIRVIKNPTATARKARNASP